MSVTNIILRATEVQALLQAGIWTQGSQSTHVSFPQTWRVADASLGRLTWWPAGFPPFTELSGDIRPKDFLPFGNTTCPPETYSRLITQISNPTKKLFLHILLFANCLLILHQRWLGAVLQPLKTNKQQQRQSLMYAVADAVTWGQFLPACEVATNIITSTVAVGILSFRK
jgi:hypothetical protein